MWIAKIRCRFAAFGADARRWPRGRLAGLWARLARSRGFSRERADAEALDRTLDLWRVESAGADLAERIARRATGLPQRPAPSPRLSEPVFVWPFSSPWPGIAGIVLALLLGFLLGWYGGRENLRSSPPEDWLGLASLASIQEEFNDR